MFIKKLTKQVISNPDSPVVQTKAGKLRGLLTQDAYIFRGIRYAQAKRFHMPEPVAPWTGVKDAIVYGAVCPEVTTVLPHDQYTVPHVFYPQDEDCQFLNVWTQALDENAKKPVLVWLHGGGFSTGSGIEHFAYDGEELSKFGDVVVVTLNHRLNLLGFLDLSAYGEQYKYSANVGMADIVEALRWVRDNIAAFGGDPNNVTLFGQSGGGGKVAALLQTPSADGLFHRAVIQSGVTRGFPPNGDTCDMAAAILQALDIAPENAHQLETLPYHRIARVVAKMNAGMRFAPKQDDDFYLGSAFDVGVCAHAKTIPVVVGTVLGEFSNNFNRSLGDNRKNTWSEPERRAQLQAAFGDAADEVIAAFQKAYPDKNMADAAFVDTMFRVGALEYAALRAQSGCCGTYNYVFALESPLYGGTLPWHNAEIPYVFHNAQYLEPSYIPGVTEQLQPLVAGAWVNFAKTGNPNTPGLPRWDEVTPQHTPTMLFDKTCRVGVDHDKDLMAALTRHPAQTQPLNRAGQPLHFGGGPRV